MDYSTRYRSINDASMRHRHTFIGVKNLNDNSITAAYVEEVRGSRDNPRFVLVNQAGVESSITMDDRRSVTHRPLLGMVDYRCPRTDKDYAVWIESTADRQVKRSLDFRLLSHKIINSSQLFEIANCSIEASRANKFKAVETFYNKDYIRFNNALSLIESGERFSVAVSEKFALSCYRYVGVAIYYKSYVVGYINEAGLPVLLDAYTYLREQLQEIAR